MPTENGILICFECVCVLLFFSLSFIHSYFAGVHSTHNCVHKSVIVNCISFNIFAYCFCCRYCCYSVFHEKLKMWVLFQCTIHRLCFNYRWCASTLVWAFHLKCSASRFLLLLLLLLVFGPHYLSSINMFHFVYKYRTINWSHIFNLVPIWNEENKYVETAFRTKINAQKKCKMDKTQRKMQKRSVFSFLRFVASAFFFDVFDSAFLFFSFRKGAIQFGLTRGLLTVYYTKIAFLCLWLVATWFIQYISLYNSVNVAVSGSPFSLCPL